MPSFDDYWAKCGSCEEPVAKTVAFEHMGEYFHPDCIDVWKCKECGAFNENEENRCAECGEEGREVEP